MTSDAGQPAATGASQPSEPAPSTDRQLHPIRLALGLAVLAGERINRGAVPSPGLALGVGVLKQASDEAQALAQRVLRPATRAVSRAIDQAPRPAPGSAVATQARQLLARVAAETKRRGDATIAAGRSDASAFIRSNIADSISWAQNQAIPQLIDGLVPHLERVMPRLIEGVLPEIRNRVLPAVVEDLTDNPHVRHLVLEEGKQAANRATSYLREATADADDRVENAVRHLGRRQSAGAAMGPRPGA